MRASLLVLLILFVACSGSTNTGPAGQNTTGSTTGSTTSSGVTYAITKVDDCGDKAGTQTVMVNKGSGVAFATIAEKTNSTTDCTPQDRPTQQVPNYAICYGEASGSTISASEAAAIPMIAFTGVALAVSPNGTTTIAYTGGPNAPERCGGSDLLAISKTGAAFAAAATLATDAASSGLFCAPVAPAPAPPTYLADMTTCGTSPDCVMNVCGQGTAVGIWPALTYDTNNNLIAVYRDIHFGFASDDFAKSDVEMKKGSAGVQTIDVAQGGGWYSRVGTTSDGKISVVHYNSEGPAGTHGIWAHRETGAGITRQKISDRAIGEIMGFAISPNGTHGVVFFDTQTKHLGYLESTDGITWNEVEYIDSNGNVGLQPSITFDATNEPVVSYYRCSATTDDSNCDQAKDGLWVARRVQGSWKKTIVSQDTAAFDGTYSAVALVGGKIWIAFEKKTFDPSVNPPTGTTYRSLYLAKEP